MCEIEPGINTRIWKNMVGMQSKLLLWLNEKWRIA